AELVARPIVKVIGARQCSTSRSMNLREFNIARGGLQANHASLTNKTPWPSITLPFDMTKANLWSAPVLQLLILMSYWLA
ncbi:hypothetical protein M3A49_42100, partial [Paraburkholderia sp. CNPSo 3076]|uniref:hypothetical protein n=1 Tax=Paraburkholderia sp. CNPSo 3076 TaxID=2940936 RepID=UPI00224EFDE7